eukprot:gene4360-4407_t
MRVAPKRWARCCSAVATSAQSGGEAGAGIGASCAGSSMQRPFRIRSASSDDRRS